MDLVGGSPTVISSDLRTSQTPRSQKGKVRVLSLSPSDDLSFILKHPSEICIDKWFDGIRKVSNENCPRTSDVYEGIFEQKGRRYSVGIRPGLFNL